MPIIKRTKNLLAKWNISFKNIQEEINWVVKHLKGLGYEKNRWDSLGKYHSKTLKLKNAYIQKVKIALALLTE